MNIGRRVARYTALRRQTDITESTSHMKQNSTPSPLRTTATTTPPSLGLMFGNNNAQGASLASPTHNKINVLVADDNPINLQLLVMFMRKNKYSYAEAHNGLEALEKYKDAAVQNSRFDYVLMDMSMPVMDGLESTRLIRKFEEEWKVEATTIIALTSFASAQAQYEALSSGVNHYLPKPIKLFELKYLMEK